MKWNDYYNWQLIYMDFVDKKSTNAFACERSGVYKGSTKANIEYKNK